MSSKSAYSFVLAVDPKDPNTSYIGAYTESGTRRGVVFKSTDGGSSWIELGSNVFGNYNNIYCLAVDPHTSNTVYAGSYNGLFKSINGGHDWTNIHPITVTCFKIHPKSSQKLFVGARNGVYYSPDAGKTWGIMRAGLNVPFIGSLEFNANAKYLFAGTRGGSVARYATQFMKKPKKPTTLKAKALAGRKIKLTWKDKATNEEGYKIERRQGSSGSWTEIAVLDPNKNAYTDTVSSSATLYQFRIRAFNAFGASVYSNLANAASK